MLSDMESSDDVCTMMHAKSVGAQIVISQMAGWSDFPRYTRYVDAPGYLPARCREQPGHREAVARYRQRNPESGHDNGPGNGYDRDLELTV